MSRYSLPSLRGRGEGEGLVVVIVVIVIVVVALLPFRGGRVGLSFLIQPLQLFSNLVVDTLCEGFHCHSSLLATALLTH